MKKIILARAGGTTKETPSVSIEISGSIPKIMSEKSMEVFYDQQAESIVDAIREHLPSGTVERVLVGLLKTKLSQYRGRIDD